MANGTQDIRYKRLLRALSAGRKTSGISQADLANKLKKTQQFISKYESGERRLDPIEFTDICRALGLDPGALLDDAVPTVLTAAKKMSGRFD